MFSSSVDMFAFCTISQVLLLSSSLLMNAHNITIHSQIHFEPNKRDGCECDVLLFRFVSLS